MKQYSTAVAVSPTPARAASAKLRSGVKSVGVVCIAAALVGALSLPAAAFSPQAEQFSEEQLSSIVAENAPPYALPTDVVPAPRGSGVEPNVELYALIWA